MAKVGRAVRDDGAQQDSFGGSGTDTFIGLTPVVRAGLSKYEAMVEAIAGGIESGALKAGARLPPQRELARYFGVTVATVTKAIDLAARRGLVVARAGSGTFICHASDDDTSGERLNFFDLSLNSPPVVIAAPLLQRSLAAIATSADVPKLFGYSPIPGSARNRRAGAAWFALRNLNVFAEQILITQGAHEGLICALLALAKPGDTILCERLNYAGLKRIAQLLQLRLVGLDVDIDGIDTAAMSRFRKDPTVKAIVCTPVTHNPTTATLSRPRRDALLRFARGASIPIVEDDIYGLLAGTDTIPLASEWPEGVIVVSSLSKSVSPGIRLGYVAAPPALVSRVQDAMFMLGWTEPSMQAAIASQLILSGDAFQSTLLHRKEARRRVELASKILGKFMITPLDAVTYHIWVQTGHLRPSEVTAELYRLGVLVSPSSHFVVDESSEDAAVRISLGGNSTYDELRAPLESVAKVLASGRSMSFGAIV